MKAICLDAGKIVAAVIDAQMKDAKGIAIWYPHEEMMMGEACKILKKDFELEDNQIIVVTGTDEELEKLAERLTAAEVRFELHGGKNGKAR